MPWVRIDENIIDHPKFLALTPLAFWLWVEGLTYCQKHLTDGRIPKAMVKGMRHYSPAAVKCLTAPLVPQKGPLWHVEENGDVIVHDYLEHNDSRELILAKRSAARDRMKGKRSREHGREHLREHPREHPEQCSQNTLRGGECKDLRSVGREGGLGETEPRTNTERAGAFCEWYADAHLEIVGVGYMGSLRDYQKAIELCGKFTDQELQDAATIWFGQTDDFARNGTRSVPKFASRASDLVLRARRVTA